MEIDNVLQALTEPDLRAAWNACVSTLMVECGVAGLCVRWVFTRVPRLTQSVMAGPSAGAIESFLSRNPMLAQGNGSIRCLEWETPIAARELQDVPVEVFVADTLPKRAVEGAQKICAEMGFKAAAAHSYRVLQANLAARKMAVVDNVEATLLVDERGHVHARNEVAAEVLKRCGDVVEEMDDGRLRFPARKDEVKFREGVKDALVEGGCSRRLMLGEELMLVVKACRMPVGLGQERLARVTMRKLTDPIEINEREMTVFLQVSPLQVKLAQALLRGDTVSSHAESIGCSESTVRWHLARLMDSLGCRKQSDVVLKLSRMCG